MSPISNADRPAAQLIDIKALSAVLSRSVSALERDQAAGRLPPPVRVGGSKRWRLADVHAWVAAGCPVPPNPEADRD